MSSGDRPLPARRRSADSPWGSEEGREFLQERLGAWSKLLFFIVGFFFFAGWGIALAWTPVELTHGLPLRWPHLLNLGEIAVLGAMWSVCRSGPLPPEILRAVDAGGTFLASVLGVGMCFGFPYVYRPDLLAVIVLFGTHLYRAAVVPSDPARSAWIAAISSLPLPVLTYLAYSRGAHPAGAPSAWAYATYALLFSGLVVLLSRKVSLVIYGLRETVRAARRLGPYTLVEKIGEGGMGTVYRARHALLRRPTAIKILPPERAGEMDLARFEREVQMTSQLTSPHTVSIYDYGRTPDGLFYYAMEYLDGIDLEELVRRDGPMHPGRVVHVLRQVCEALGEAHHVGLIHRDVKPANILLSERGGRPDVAKVVDFGLVKSVSARDGVTLEDAAPGTPHYMSPEALRTPDRVDARSDLYALGATAYFLLTGRPVFEGSLPEVFAHQLGTPPVRPSERLGRPLPEALESLVLAALAKTPDERPESASAFADALSRCAGVSPWTEAEAAGWWREAGARIKAARSGAEPPRAAPALTIERLPAAAQEEIPGGG